jgi:hypothetical protein
LNFNPNYLIKHTEKKNEKEINELKNKILNLEENEKRYIIQINKNENKKEIVELKRRCNEKEEKINELKNIIQKFDEEKNVLKDSSVLSFASDIYALGMCLKSISKVAEQVLDMCGATEAIYNLVLDMTKDEANERLTSLEVLQRTDLLLDKLRSEYLALEKQKENVRNMGKALNKARLDLEFAANLAEDDLNEHRQKELEQLQSQIQERQKVMSAQAVTLCLILSFSSLLNLSVFC